MPPRQMKAATGTRRSTRTTYAPELFAQTNHSVTKTAKAPATKRKAADDIPTAPAKRTSRVKVNTKPTPTVTNPTAKKSTTTRKAPVSRTTKSTTQPSRVTKPAQKPATRPVGRPRKTTKKAPKPTTPKRKAAARGRPKKTVAVAQKVDEDKESSTSGRSDPNLTAADSTAPDVARAEEVDDDEKALTSGTSDPDITLADATAPEVDTAEEVNEDKDASTSALPYPNITEEDSAAPEVTSAEEVDEGKGASISAIPNAITAPEVTTPEVVIAEEVNEDNEDSTSPLPKLAITLPEVTIPDPPPFTPKKIIAYKFRTPDNYGGSFPCPIPKVTPAGVSTSNDPPTERLLVFFAGVGESGELGMGTDRKTGMNAKRPRLNKLLEKEDVVLIAPAAMHCVALTRDNRILTWGVNDQGALGRHTDWDGGLKDMNDADSDSEDDQGDSGLNPREASPAAIPSESFPPNTRFTNVVASDSATFALTTDGKVYGWGTFRDNNGILGFQGDGDVQRTPILIDGLHNITQIVCGNNHVVALNSYGTVFSFGAGQQNQLGRTIHDEDRFDALRPHTFGLPKGEITSIHAGADHSFALGTGWRVWSWGLNNYHQCGIGNTPGQSAPVVSEPTLCTTLLDKELISISGGNHHTVALTSKGDVLVWGRADGGQLGIDVENLHESIVERSDSTGKIGVVKGATHVKVLAGEVVTHITTATDHSIAVTRDGQAFTWGFSQLYQTGLGTDEDVRFPSLVDNTAVRGKMMTGAGCGGQFSVFTCAAGTAEHTPVVPAEALPGAVEAYLLHNSPLPPLPASSP